MDETSPNIEADAPPALDPAQQSLSEALRVSFGILKIVMVVLLIAYAFSGTFSVGSNEVALRLRFGNYVGSPGQRVLERGTYLAAPFPIEQIVKVDTRPSTLLLEDEFWFETTKNDSGLTRSQLQFQKAGPLHPLRDGSLITGDSNIVHAKWALTWRITDPVAYLTNIGSKEVAQEFESLFVNQMLKSARSAKLSDGLLDSEAYETYKGLLDQEYSKTLAKNHIAENYSTY